MTYWLIHLGLCHGTPASGDRSVLEINKAALARELKKTISPVKVIPQSSVTVIDEMDMIQKMKGYDKTSQLAKSPRAVILMLSLTFTRRRHLMMEKEPKEVQTQESSSGTLHLVTISSSGQSCCADPLTRHV